MSIFLTGYRLDSIVTGSAEIAFNTAELRCYLYRDDFWAHWEDAEQGEKVTAISRPDKTEGIAQHSHAPTE